jgi:predicted RNA polymerase sigma factor
MPDEPEVLGLLALMLLTDAAAAYDAAIGRTENLREQAFLRRARSRL